METLVFPRPLHAPARRRTNWWLIAALGLNAALWPLIIKGLRMIASAIAVGGFLSLIAVWVMLASVYAGSPA